MPAERKAFRNAGRAHARLLDAAAENEAAGIFFHRKPAQRLDGINAAGGQEDEIRTMPARKFKAVRGAEQIGVNDVAGIAAIAGVHARLGGCFDHDVGLSLIHISEPTRLGMISYAVFCLKKKK